MSFADRVHAIRGGYVNASQDFASMPEVPVSYALQGTGEMTAAIYAQGLRIALVTGMARATTVAQDTADALATSDMFQRIQAPIHRVPLAVMAELPIRALVTEFVKRMAGAHASRQARSDFSPAPLAARATRTMRAHYVTWHVRPSMEPCAMGRVFATTESARSAVSCLRMWPCGAGQSANCPQTILHQIVLLALGVSLAAVALACVEALDPTGRSRVRATVFAIKEWQGKGHAHVDWDSQERIAVKNVQGCNPARTMVRVSKAFALALKAMSRQTAL